MNEIFPEIGIIVLLILMNAFFSGTEMALISLRKTRIKELVKKGNRKAILAEKILSNPEKFLATIQVGITLISTIASAYAGASISKIISPLLEASSWSFISENASTISFTIIVIGITYLSIVLGELVPKSLGIKYSEKFSLFSAYPIYFLSRIFSPITKFLTISSNAILKIFGDQTSFSEAKITEEELRTILYESHKAGTIKKHEHEILDNIFDFSDIAVEQIMTPFSKIFAVDINEPNEKNIEAIIESGYTRIPVYKDKIDNILGVLNIKDLLRELRKNPDFHKIEDLITKTRFVPNTQRISDLLKKFQKEKKAIAIVTDEHGDVDGLITIEDILEEIVGDIDDENDEKNKFIISQKDGIYEVEGSSSIVDFNRYFNTNLPEDEAYTTISGIILEKLESIPEVGTKTTIDNLEFTIKEKTERAIKVVTVKKLSPETVA
ncbi:MAG: hemolysin family protein [Candidatus Peregrinibacteria bacterium]|nr:hemolysin family protein [Candidatus Peregrinibacteria bacterium]